LSSGSAVGVVVDEGCVGADPAVVWRLAVPWASEQVCVVRLVDREAVMDKLLYTATNPVQDHLVDQVQHWPASTAWPRCWPDTACARSDRGTSSG
jgi:hypothetical protein